MNFVVDIAAVNGINNLISRIMYKEKETEGSEILLENKESRTKQVPERAIHEFVNNQNK